jgi:hypothetical protein
MDLGLRIEVFRGFLDKDDVLGGLPRPRRPLDDIFVGWTHAQSIQTLDLSKIESGSGCFEGSQWFNPSVETHSAPPFSQTSHVTASQVDWRKTRLKSTFPFHFSTSHLQSRELFEFYEMKNQLEKSQN